MSDQSSYKEAVKTYRKLSKIPSVLQTTCEELDSDNYIVTSLWKQRDLEKSCYTYFKTYQNLSKNTLELGQNIGLPNEVNGKQISAYSDSTKKTAIIQTIKMVDNINKQFLEIWTPFRKEINIDLKKEDKHGKVHYNIQFSAIDWSQNGKRFLYIAEKKIEESQSYFEKKMDEKKRTGMENEYKENWGEQLTDCHQPTLCIYDCDANEIMTYEDILPAQYSYGQAVWFDDDNIILVGWKHEPTRLGLIYCTNRPTILVKLTLSSKAIKILDNGKGNYSPRVHPSEKYIIYLESPGHGPHNNCVRLMKILISTNGSFNKPIPIVDAVNNAAKQKNGFPGLYLLSLPKNCFTQEDDSVILSSVWRTCTLVLCIHLSDGKITKLSSTGQWTVLDVKDNIIISSYSTPSIPENLRIGKIYKGKTSWSPVNEPEIDNMEWSVISIKPEWKNPNYEDFDYDCILIKPKNFSTSDRKELIVNPHGGPHSVSTTAFLLQNCCLCSLGYAVVNINYRGSVGYGKDNIYSLPTNIGKQDTSDVQQVATNLKQQLNCEKVFLTGGSHGGFLTLSLIAQYPSFYTSAVVRNPVTNFISMEGTSDIPDWTYCEATSSEYHYDILFSNKDCVEANPLSPLQHVYKVKTPCLLMLGDSDARCPPSQGLSWAKKYKAFGGKCKVLWYKDNCHPLDKVDSESDGFVNMVRWFVEHSQ